MKNLKNPQRLRRKKIKKFNVEKQTKINNDFEKVVDSMKANIAY